MTPPKRCRRRFDGFDEILSQRITEADEFYDAIHPRACIPTSRCVQRQAFAGLLWSKQFYHYSVELWLDGDPAGPPPPASRAAWPQSRMAAPVQPRHDLDARQVGISLVRGLGPGVSLLPLAHDRSGIRQAAVDADAARMVHASQRPDSGLRMEFRRRESAGARLGRVARLQDRPQRDGRGRHANSWKKYSKDAAEFHLVGESQRLRPATTSFKAASSGLDNIGVFDRSRPLPDGGVLEQADGTAWMGMYCLNMLAIALELAPTRGQPTKASPRSSSSISFTSPTPSTPRPEIAACGTPKMAFTTT